MELGEIRVASHDNVPFRDRREAGRLLARELAPLRAGAPVVLGIPRGGVVVAAEIAAALGADLDVVLARKIGAPHNPEFAIGAVAEDGRLFVDDALLAALRVPAGHVEREHARQVSEIARRAAAYRAVRPKVPLAGRVVVVADDGIATGATMQAALWTSRREGASRLVAAVPVAPQDALPRIGEAADETVCLLAPADFSAVGQFYLGFDQVEDAEVIALLRAAPPARRPGA